MKRNLDFLAQMREATRQLKDSGSAAVSAVIQRTLQEVPSLNSAAEPFADFVARVRNVFDDKWPGSAGQQEKTGRFLSASCTNHAGTRSYKLYVPSRYKGQRLPLIVMLHGCQQNPDDFAAGTGMNVVAEQNNCFVVYPAQAHARTGANCWSWYQAGDQQREYGEPSIIADITRAVIGSYRIDSRRVYVAGLSAGGAMAAIMGEAYPDLYAAVGIHSGVLAGAARDVASAFAVMRNGMTAAGVRSRKHMRSPARFIPAIVFHGDCDTTVHPRNGDQVFAQCAPDLSCNHAGHQHNETIEKGKAPQGRLYTRTIRRDGNGKAIAEHWVVHGAGHAWSGGSREGSFTDPAGPNAAQEMLRFFYSHTQQTR